MTVLVQLRAQEWYQRVSAITGHGNEAAETYDGAARLEATKKGIVERRGDCYEFRGAEKSAPLEIKIHESFHTVAVG